MDPYFTQAYPQGINPASFPHFNPNGNMGINVAGPSTSSAGPGPSSNSNSSRPPHPIGQISYTASSTMTTQSPVSSRSHESPTHNGGAGPSSLPMMPYVEPHQDLQSFLESFWTRQVQETEDREEDFKGFGLPLARIKKVMKSDEEVKMISAEAPVMFSKACEIFISELTCRAWLVAESHKRRTLQKSDVAEAIGLSDMFDFLIDIVPREEEGDPPGNGAGQGGGVEGGEGVGKGDDSREEEELEDEEEDTG